LIPVFLSKNPGFLRGVSAQLWGQNTVSLLDVDRKIVTSFSTGKGELPAIVILGPDFQQLYKGGNALKGSYYYTKPGRPKVNVFHFKEGLAKIKGQGLLSGLVFPEKHQKLIPAIKSMKLSMVQKYLDGFRDRDLDKDAELKTFVLELKKRLSALEEKKRKLFEDLEKAGNKWGAFKAAGSYLRVFPKNKASRDILAKAQKYKREESIRNEIAAEGLFARVMAMTYGPMSKPASRAQAQKLFKQVAAKYKDTEYGKLCAGLGK
jgi:hypothetical protein